MPRTIFSRIAFPFAPLLPALAAGGTGVWLAWRRWIDPLADSGREFDVPARVAAGERLLHEIPHYYYGPLWPWVGSVFVRAFGRRFAALEIPAGVVAVSIVVGLFFTVRRSAGLRAAAIAAALTAAIALPAFTPAALMFPYSVSNSLALAAGFLVLASIGLKRGGPAAAIGLTATMLARPEVGLALAAASILAGWRAEDRSLRGRFVIPALASTAVSGAIYGAVFRGIPFSLLIERSPLVVLAPEATLRRFFLESSGLFDPSRTILTVTGDLLLVAAVLGAIAAISAPDVAPRVSRTARLLAVAAAAGLIAAFRVATMGPAHDLDSSIIFVGVPLLCVLADMALLARGPIRTEHLIPFLTFAFAAAASVRVFFQLRLTWITAYSAFAFPSIAAASAIFLLGPWRPRFLDRNLLESALSIVAAAVIAVQLSLLVHYRRTHPGRFIETPAGAVWLNAERAPAFECLISEIAVRANRGDGLIGLPEGGFFNFVTGLPNTAGESMVMPGALSSRSEAELSTRLDLAGPRFVVLANRPTPEYETKFFGVDYAQRISAAIGRSYHVARSCGIAKPDAPVGARFFFLRLYERNSGLAKPASSR